MQDFHLKVPKVNLSKNKTLDSNLTPIPNKDFSNSNSIHSCLPKKKKLTSYRVPNNGSRDHPCKSSGQSPLDTLFFGLIPNFASYYFYILLPLQPIAYTMEILVIKSLGTSHIHCYILVHYNWMISTTYFNIWYLCFCSCPSWVFSPHCRGILSKWKSDHIWSSAQCSMASDVTQYTGLPVA